MACEKLYKDAIGPELILDTHEADLPNAVTFKILWQSPNGDTGEWEKPNVTIVENTKIKRRFEAGDLFEASTKDKDWRFMTYVELQDGYKSPGCTYTHRVYNWWE
jgi:hypothetical protein